VALTPADGKVLAPVAIRRLPEFSASTRLLVVAPHPDDETIATGLLIQQVREAGGEVRILLLTSGDNNPWPQRWLERRLRIGAAERKRWGERRQAEMLQALRRLGLPESSLQSLGWPDLGLTRRLLQATQASVAALAAAIDAFSPSLVLAPALSDHHPDHGAAHVLVRLAMAGQVEPVPLLTYLVHGDRGGDTAFEVAGSAAQLASKFAALEAHGSQMALSGKRMRRMAGRPECYAWPASALVALPWQPPIGLRPWLRLGVVSLAGVDCWRWARAPLARDDTGRWGLLPSVQVNSMPMFARLALSLPTPWIFDHWGWCELSRGDVASKPPLARVDRAG
jgi:N-acetyl-1-D-myo-inositol-2-amino-2-deoxy-alpha-D-glucopyranoside deacetylase